jgi:hypothetical protein
MALSESQLEVVSGDSASVISLSGMPRTVEKIADSLFIAL